MPWRADAPHGGFTTGTPWLPMGEANLARAVDWQANDPASLLALTRAALALRRVHPALRHGAFDLLHADGAVLAFARSTAKQGLVCVFNLAPEAVSWPAGLAKAGRTIASANCGEPGRLPAYAAVVFEAET
ncbi:MAG: DUF3459 domain-containing protein, partial [Novosphingobium sp.]|nr:DUF3459 domain-containing protein [Novosphingobium sp.]